MIIRCFSQHSFEVGSERRDDEQCRNGITDCCSPFRTGLEDNHITTMKRNRLPIALALVAMVAIALSGGGVAATDGIDVDVELVDADDAEVEHGDEFTLEQIDETEFEELSVTVTADENTSADDSIVLRSDDTEPTALDPETHDNRTTASDEFDVTTDEVDSVADVGPAATYDIDGTIDPGEATAYGTHSLAPGETLTVDVSWDAADSDLCLGIMTADGDIICTEESDGQGSVTFEVEESGDYYAFVGNEGPYTAEYTGHYRV
ncbi:hypothetical protein C482_00870 [Natrialba chahannaoensis JCM 10990]|uniref:Peptidase domain-containing protein n=2 Tax=Natrialba chahannaoensis TaxID=68911 RepID=M0B679_9EURY|nr:hypothetical protein C482_00870 [Natrialba chahannaoensis JCM 10990]